MNESSEPKNQTEESPANGATPEVTELDEETLDRVAGGYGENPMGPG